MYHVCEDFYDTTMFVLMSDFASYQSVVRFSSWCSTNFLHVNVSKMKEMCIDIHCHSSQ